MDNYQIEAERLKNLMTSAATDLNIQEEHELEYTQLRRFLLNQVGFKEIAPKFVMTCGTLKEFKREMQAVSQKYAERRKHIKDEFYPLINSIYETKEQIAIPSVPAIKEVTKEQKNKIELSTRQNILDAFIVTKIKWYGNMEQKHFLGRLFNLSKLPSNDERYKTADEDIYKHTVLNDDWKDEWVFTDARFNLLHTQDSIFLDFLCFTIHPTVRDSDEQIVILQDIYNNNISANGFEIVQRGQIAGKPIFSPQEIIHAIPATPIITDNEKKLALVIGCSNYGHVETLANPTNDANAMGEVLHSLGFEVIKVLNPTQKELKISIDDFGEKLHKYKTGLFYFAGHGIQVKGLNYLIPVDANLKNERMVEYDCVETTRVLSLMEGSKSLVNVVILDACRNNPFERSWGRNMGLRGLATMDAPKGSLIAYSTSPGKTASDGHGENGLYTEALLTHIGRKQTTITSMFQNVRNDVIKKSNDEQVPWESTSLTSDFFFNP
jgi:hypothetical protein